MKVANKIYIAVGIMIVLQLANSLILSARSSGLQKVTDTVLAPLSVRVRQASEWSGLAQANAARARAAATTADAAAQGGHQRHGEPHGRVGKGHAQCPAAG